jgi:HK97 family phage major capsid protein
MANAYLDRLRAQHEELVNKSEEAQNRAVAEDRDLTEEENRSLAVDAEKAKGLAAQITDLHEQEVRAAAVAALAPIAPRPTSGTSANDRDPGHYRSTEEGGQNSFFGDMYRSQYTHDSSAQRRLDEHMRAGETVLGVNAVSTKGIAGNAGIIPPKFLTDLYLPLSRQNRVVANLVTHLDLGNDARPMVLPLQTAGTDSVVGTPADEFTSPTNTPVFQTSTETLTPGIVSGQQIVSRLLLDSSTPGVDVLIATDLLSVYDSQIETKVNAALVAAATANTVTFATDHSGGTASANWNYVAAGVINSTNAVIDTTADVWSGVFSAPQGIAMNPQRYAAYRKLTDLQGRPLLTPYGPQNSVGNSGGDNLNGPVGELEGLPVYVTTGLGTAIGDTQVLGLFKDAILAESNLLQFRFEEVKGPNDIVLGIWRYAGVLVRRGGRGVGKIVVTAA